jgi:toxin ParE1/3/4
MVAPSRRVIIRAMAQEQLRELHSYIVESGRRAIADRYIDALLRHCDSLGAFPMRGVAREDLRPGLRLTHYKGRAVIAYPVRPDQVEVLGVFYGGQDVNAAFEEDNRTQSDDSER